ncbi:MAG: diguanylate cyclase [Thermomicrobiales bacterium]
MQKQRFSARYGGDEFALILPKMNRTLAENMANWLQKDLESRDWTDLGPDFVVSASFGMIVVDSEASHVGILAAADRQLYSAKRLGKNRVVAGVITSELKSGL